MLLLSRAQPESARRTRAEIYGTDDLGRPRRDRREGRGRRTGSTLEHLQSNHEGELVERVHAARGRCAAIVINAGALTHYGWSLHDALGRLRRAGGRGAPVEHRTPASRGATRRCVTPVAERHASRGFGAHGYELAIEAVARLLEA